MRQIRHLFHFETVASQELREGDLVVPARVALVDPRAAADAIDEVGDRERVGRRDHEPAARLEVTPGRVEEAARARQVLDDLPRPDHVERSAEIERLRVGGDDVEAHPAGAGGQCLVDLDPHDLGRDRGDRRVHPVGPGDAGAGADVEHGLTLEIAPNPRESFGVTPRLPILGLKRMARRHRVERRRRIIAAAAVALVAAACSGSGHPTASTQPPVSSTTATAPTPTIPAGTSRHRPSRHRPGRRPRRRRPSRRHR